MTTQTIPISEEARKTLDKLVLTSGMTPEHIVERALAQLALDPEFAPSDDESIDAIGIPGEPVPAPKRKEPAMPTTDENVIVHYTGEILPNSIIPTENATNVLRNQIIKFGGIAPPIHVIWSIVNENRPGNPLYSLRLADSIDDPDPFERTFYHDVLVHLHPNIHPNEAMDRMLVEFLSRRARRQATSLNTATRSSIPMSL
jgi:hypothetical protein